MVRILFCYWWKPISVEYSDTRSKLFDYEKHNKKLKFNGLCYKKSEEWMIKRKYTPQELKTIIYIDDNNQVRNVKVGSPHKNNE